jgi:redox-sensitive bicupin YhaK (pirin superfamily)
MCDVAPAWGQSSKLPAKSELQTMMNIRKAEERGPTKIGWLDSRHSFSFGEYYDPRFMGFRALRVINEDRVAPASGFPTHGHRDMEILSYVLDGALEHKDSLGTGSVIRPGEVQRMTAGSGIRHSEFNASREKPVHFLQIWIEPSSKNLAPSYEQKTFAPSGNAGRFRLIASPDGRDGSLTIHQDAALYAAHLAPGEQVEHVPTAGRHVWLQVARGSVRVFGKTLAAGDGAAISDESRIAISGTTDAEVLLFDLA